MIKNDSLENRLNAHREGDEIPKFHNENEESLIKETNEQNQKFDIYNFVLYVIEIFLFFAKSFTYGFSIKLIMNTNWNLFSFMCLGLGITFLLETIASYFNKNN
jgi:hypothetical protein